ncbi:MAG: Transcriptional regulatory protein DegU [Ignavibacteria bacterium]|nr:Transcriptional regulatory protein DegU [Ignavibacteria bacterium]
MKSEKKIKIVIADDHPIFRNGLRQVIEEDKNIEILAEAENGIKALDYIRQFNPDVILLDIDMPKKTGLEVLNELKDSGKEYKAIFLTVYADEDIFDEAMELGISGYVLKDSAVSDIIECINKVYEGHYYISPSVSNLLINRDQRQMKFKSEQTWQELLTKTEKQILAYIAGGHTSREISELTGSSFKTIENHRANISSKLNLRGANSLLKFAIENKDKINF